MKSQNLFTAAALALALTACSSPKSASVLNASSNGIVNGQEVKAGEEAAVSTVGLYLKIQMQTPFGPYETFSTCTGTLISENIVLTAAHCMEGVTAGAVVFGTDFSSTDESMVRGIVDAMVHPEYMPVEPGNGDWNDISLVEFEGTIPAGYAPAPVLKDVSKLTSGLPVIFAGFGITSPAGGESQDPDDSGVLRQADTVLTSATYEGNELLFNLTSDGVSTCQGDSGGPAYAKVDGKLTVIGVTSRGENARCDGVSISTNVAEHADFIEKGSKQLLASAAPVVELPTEDDAAPAVAANE